MKENLKFDNMDDLLAHAESVGIKPLCPDLYAKPKKQTKADLERIKKVEKQIFGFAVSDLKWRI